MYSWNIRYLNKYPEALFYTIMVLSILGGISNYRNSEEPFINFIWWFFVGILSGIIAISISVFKWVSMKKSKENLLALCSKFEFGGMSAFICSIIFFIIFAIAGYQQYKEEGFFEIDNYDEIFILAALVGISGLILFIIGKIKSNKYS